MATAYLAELDSTTLKVKPELLPDPPPKRPVAVFGTARAAVGGGAAYKAVEAQPLTLALLRCETAPAGTALTVQLQTSPDRATWTNRGSTLTIPIGGTSEVSAALTYTMPANTYLRANITSAGATAPATGVVVDVFG